MVDARYFQTPPIRLGPFMTLFLITVLLTLPPPPFDLNATLVPLLFSLRYPTTTPVICFSQHWIGQ